MAPNDPTSPAGPADGGAPPEGAKPYYTTPSGRRVELSADALAALKGGAGGEVELPAANGRRVTLTVPVPGAPGSSAAPPAGAAVQEVQVLGANGLPTEGTVRIAAPGGDRLQKLADGTEVKYQADASAGDGLHPAGTARPPRGVDAPDLPSAGAPATPPASPAPRAPTVPEVVDAEFEVEDASDDDDDAPPPVEAPSAAPPTVAAAATAPVTVDQPPAAPARPPTSSPEAVRPAVLEPLEALESIDAVAGMDAVDAAASHAGADTPSAPSVVPLHPAAPEPPPAPDSSSAGVAGQPGSPRTVPASSPRATPAPASPPPTAGLSAASPASPSGAWAERASSPAEGAASMPTDGGDEDDGMGKEDPDAQTSMDRADAAGVELRSEELDEILTSMPGGLLRWGSTAVAVTLVVMLGIAWFIRYPDVVQGRVSLTTLTPPVRVVARAAGEVSRVFAADRSHVRAGDPLLLLKNPADYRDVAALSAALDRLDPALQRGTAVPDVAFDRPLVLGDLQTPYSAFLQAFSDYRRVQADPFYGQKLDALRQQIASHEQLRQRLAAQQTLLDEQLALADRARTRARQLAGQAFSSSAEVDKAEQEYLAQRFASENGRTALTNNDIQLAAQRSALLDMEGRRSDDGQKLLVELRNAHHSLRAAISRWEQDYLLRSPVSGTVSLFRDLHENLFVNASEPLVAVVPSGGALLGRVTLSGLGAGKVRAGQRVIIHFDSYPYKEYGVVEGRVRTISQLGFEQPQGQGKEFLYQAEVGLPNGLVTSYNRKLEFRQEMRGDVQVVTDDLRLLERVFNQLRSLRDVN